MDLRKNKFKTKASNKKRKWTVSNDVNSIISLPLKLNKRAV